MIGNMVWQEKGYTVRTIFQVGPMGFPRLFGDYNVKKCVLTQGRPMLNVSSIWKWINRLAQWEFFESEI